ncbi:MULTISPECIES: ATP-binding cassette domain-containing protein [Lacticaseibacillus]|uniref:ATP-binding cassette domain-containing protein n=1 Tax=Lacticaseibacillus TaxID=2759736 RepID=UPI00063D8ECB|nr:MULTISPECIES: ABC transporter ATP-binding protein [Lacticaseibacillus]KLI76524.1 ABC transporter ATP-binding protein [Lacticaseibacillus casei]
MLKLRKVFFERKKLIAALMLFSLIQESSPLVIGLIQKKAFDELAGHHGSLFWITVVVFLGVVIVINMSRNQYGLLDAKITFNTDKRFINSLFSKLKDIETKPASDLLNVVNVDLPSIDFAALTLTDLCVKLIFLIGSLIILLSYSRPLTVTVIIPLIIVQTVILLAQKYNEVLYRRARKSSLKYFGLMFDIITNYKYMRFLSKLHPQAAFDKQNKVQVINSLKQATYASFLTNVISFVNMLAIAFTLFVANHTNGISPGTIALFLTYIAPGFDFVTISSQTIELLQRIRFVDNKIGQLLLHMNHPNPEYGKILKRFKTEFKEGSSVLQGGDILCIVGSNTSGKSRLLREVAQTPEQYLNLDANDFDLPKPSVGYLPENPQVFHESLYNNIHLFPNPDVAQTTKASESRLKQDLLQILGLSVRFKRDLQINANKISTGEKSRIALARAALNSKLLILDRPFDAIDVARSQRILTWLKENQYIIILTADQNWIKEQANIVFRL